MLLGKVIPQRRTRHGIPLTMHIEFTPLKPKDLWPKLEAALDLVAQHSPQWIRRMQRMGNTINIRRIPGNRARLEQERNTILDPYLLANFLPAQIASSIVHEATHAELRHRAFKYDPQAPGREERACRRSELRFGRAILQAGVEGARLVVDRAVQSLAMADNQLGVVVDYREMQVLAKVTKLQEMPLPRFAKRYLARRAGVLDTPQGRKAFEK